MEQQSIDGLFSSSDGPTYPAPTSSECEFPDVAATTGYRYGCRCDRCRQAKQRSQRGAGLPVTCHREGCDQPKKRGGGYRYCEDHSVVHIKPSPCAVDGCDRPRMTIQGAMYCKAHRRVAADGRVVTRQVAAITTCPACEQTYERIKGMKNPFCANCNARYRGIINSARRHGATTEMLIGWLKRGACELCDAPIYLGKRRNGGGPQVDHDHAHCPGDRGCPRCIRGMLCTYCNMALGHLEYLMRDVGLERTQGYLNRTSGTRHDLGDVA